MCKRKLIKKSCKVGEKNNKTKETKEEIHPARKKEIKHRIKV